MFGLIIHTVQVCANTGKERQLLLSWHIDNS